MAKKMIQLRLMAVGEALGISMRQLSLSIGRSAGWVNSLGKIKSDGISSEDLSKIIEMYPTVNKDYLLTGEGSPLRDDVDTLGHSFFRPKGDDYKELCMAYRQDLADARDEIRRLREAYFRLVDTNNQLLEEYSLLQAACLKAGISPLSRAELGTKIR